MAEKISIRKIVYGSSKFREVINTNFSEFTSGDTSNNKPSLEEFFDLYNEMFLEIPETGEFSHQAIARKSQQLITPAKDAKDKEIDNLQSTIEDLEKQLLDATKPDTEAATVKEHPRFPNGSIIARPTNSPMGWPNVFVMDQGFKRAIYFSGDGPFYSSFLELQGYTDKPVPRIPDTIIDSIPTGTPLTAQNFNDPFEPPRGLEGVEELRITLDPTDAKLDFSNYEGDVERYRSELEKDYTEKGNLIEALKDKIEDISKKIQEITAG